MINLTEYVPQTAKDWRYLDRFFALLAEENLTIVRGAFGTASMDIHNRIIRIPHFAFENKDVALLMGSHEVAHALFTPDMWSHANIDANIKNKTLAMCLNIVEDIRIEKLIRRKYPGFAVIYRRGYKELLGRDFFSINSWEDFNIADRVNAVAKLGKLCPHKLTVAEECVRRYVSSCETPDDVVNRSLYLYRILKAEAKGEDLEQMIKDLIEGLKNGSVKLDFDPDAEDGDGMGAGDDLPEELKKALEDAIKDQDETSSGNDSNDFDQESKNGTSAGRGDRNMNSKVEDKIDEEKQMHEVNKNSNIAHINKNFKFTKIPRRPAR